MESVGAALDLSRAHGKQGLRSIQRLKLAFFVDAQKPARAPAATKRARRPRPPSRQRRGSGESVKVSVRRGWRLKAFPIRLNCRGREACGFRHRAQAPVVWRPSASSPEFGERLQRPRRRRSGAGAPGRGSSIRPSIRWIENRLRRLPTVLGAASARKALFSSPPPPAERSAPVAPTPVAPTPGLFAVATPTPRVGAVRFPTNQPQQPSCPSQILRESIPAENRIS